MNPESAMLTSADAMVTRGPLYKDLILDDLDLSSRAWIGARFEQCSLRNCKFKDSDLSHSRFLNCDLYCVDFSGCALYACWFTDCDLTKAVFTGALMNGMRMSGVDVTHTVFGTEVCVGKNRKSERPPPEQLIANALPFGAPIPPITEYERTNHSIAVKTYYLQINLKEDEPAEKWREWRRRSEVCKLVKRVFLENGYFEKGMEHYYTERVYRRKSMPLGLRRATDWLFGDFLWGYGVAWHRAAMSLAVSVLIFASIYLFLPQLSNASGLTLKDSSMVSLTHKGWSVAKAPAYTVYFSLMTATTSGFGDVTPERWAKLVAAIQVVCGIVLFSLLVASIARRIANV